MNCTHGGPDMNIALGDRCPWCRKIVAERTAVPAHIAANPVTPTPRTSAAAPETTLPLVSGAPIKHARNTDPDTARDAALSVTDPHKRRLYDHILTLIFEHGPLIQVRVLPVDPRESLSDDSRNARHDKFGAHARSSPTTS